MPNDDLGQFPTPTTPGQNPPTPTDQPKPVTEDTSIVEDINAPISDKISDEPFTTPPEVTPESSPTFEETPDEIPTFASQGESTPAPTPITPDFSPPSEPAPIETNTAPEPTPATVTPPTPVEIPATYTPKGGSSFGSLITIILLVVAGIAIATTVFLLSQSQQLQQQLREVTQTLDQQRTTVTPTPTPTIIEFITPTITITPEATITATPTPTLFIIPTPTATLSARTALPLANASEALRVGINHQPNAQLILIKTENATTPDTAVTKYFFRQDLTTKKYFYVMITGDENPEIVDKAIYVTPDNNIPSLNDLVLGNKLGIDLDQAVSLSESLCTSNACANATVKSQYIKVGANLIWQLSFDPQDATKDTQIIQINAETKDILYKSPGF